MKIYTRTGDKGLTSFYGGKRVSKASQRVDAYGEVDELNAHIGLCRTHLVVSKFDRILTTIQRHLMVIGSDLATPMDSHSSRQIPRITSRQVAFLENQIDKAQAALPELGQFILPAGSLSAAYLHVARTICRRAERKVAALTDKEEVNPHVLVYLNRLSDLLFVLARLANQAAGLSDEYWVLHEGKVNRTGIGGDKTPA